MGTDWARTVTTETLGGSAAAAGGVCWPQPASRAAMPAARQPFSATKVLLLGNSGTCAFIQTREPPNETRESCYKQTTGARIETIARAEATPIRCADHSDRRFKKGYTLV